MGWRPEERSSSDVGQWTTLLRRLLGHFAISTTSVECYGLSHACFYLRLSSNITTRVWIDNLYHIKPGKYHGVGTLRGLCSQSLAVTRQRRRVSSVSSQNLLNMAPISRNSLWFIFHLIASLPCRPPGIHHAEEEVVCVLLAKYQRC